MLTLIGVGHVFKIGEAVKSQITMRMPSLVCVELDRGRYEALIRRSRDKRGVPFTYKLLALFQDSVAHRYGAEVGEEMLAAVSAAKSIKADVAFIDMGAPQVFSRLWAMMSFGEKLKLLAAGAGGFFASRQKIEEELKEFEKNPDKYLQMFEQEFPAIKKVLIDERNAHMATQLRTLSRRYASIVAVIGDGHISGLTKLLRELQPEIVRLSELMAPVPEPKKTGESTASYTITHKIVSQT